MITPHPIAIVGPTGVGKSAVAEVVALRLGGEIVNADSMQVYRGMDIGTAKTPPADRLVPHHCLDLVDPGESYSAALYQRDARAAIAEILARGAVPVVVGGTGLYVRAAFDEFEFPSGELAKRHADARSRRGRSSSGPRRSTPSLHGSIRPRQRSSIPTTCDARCARSRCSPRVVRTRTRRRASAARHGPLSRGALLRPHDGPPDALRTDRRARRRDDRGGTAGRGRVRCSRRAIATRSPPHRRSATRSSCRLPRARSRSQRRSRTSSGRSRRYAKRQLTWFRADPRVTWLDVTGLSPDAAGDALLDLLESAKRLAARRVHPCSSSSPR